MALKKKLGEQPQAEGRRRFSILIAALTCGVTSIFQPLWAGTCNSASPPYDVPAQTTTVFLDIDCAGAGGVVNVTGDVDATSFAILDESSNQDSWIIDIPAGVSVSNDASSYTVQFRSPNGEVQNRGLINNAGAAGTILFNDNAGNPGLGKIFNAGTGEISSVGSAIELQAGGEIINESGGKIVSQTFTVVAAQGMIQVDNAGMIASLGNHPASAISGNGGAEINNSGEITGRLNFFNGGPLTVDNSGTITGLPGQQAIRAANIPSTISNSGEISAGAGFPNAIQLSSANDTLELQPGHVIDGAVIAGSGIDTLSFAGSGSDSFSLGDVGAANQYRDFELLRLESASWTINGTASNNFNLVGGTMNLGASAAETGDFIQSDGVVQNGTLSANLYVLSGGTFDAAFGNNNMVQIDTGTVQFGSDAVLSIGALLSIGDGGRLDLGTSGQSTGSLLLENGELLNGSLNAGAFMVQEGEIRASLSGAGAMTKDGPGTVELAGLNNYTGGTTISEGELRGTTDSLQGDIVNNGDLVFSQAGDGTYSGELSGSGGVLKIAGLGSITFSGDLSGYSGLTHVTTGTLLVDGKLGSDVNVISGVLGGVGTISGTVRIAPLVEFASLSPGGTGPGILEVGSDLELSQNSRLVFELDQPGGSNDELKVMGDLTLDGTLQVIDLGGYGSGTYRLIEYGGSLNDETLELTSLPDGFNARLDTTTAGEINLIVEPPIDEIFSDRFQQ